jgi:hypothetical protein
VGRFKDKESDIMPDLTPNLNLEKPLDNETADISVINSNMDKIDTGFGNIQQQIDNIDVTGTQITVDQSQTPASPGNGTIAQLFNWIANRIKAITGKTNWWDTPDTTLASAKSHIDAAAPHSGHETPAGAQAKVDAHANATDPHPQYALDTDFSSHTANTTTAHGINTKVSKSGDTMTGPLIIAPAGTAAIEIGRVDGVASNPFIDFHSGAIAVDYDSRIVASGGTGVAGGGTLNLIAANVITNGYKIWHAGNDGAGSGLDADKLQGKVPSDFQNNTKIYGSVTYTDSIVTNSTLTKTIALGGSYKHGIAVVSENVNNTFRSGLVFFGSNNLKTKAVGYFYGDAGIAACREFLGSVTSTNFGFYWTGNNRIRIDELYISGTNLVIVFRNENVGSNSLNCRIDWEVW